MKFALDMDKVNADVLIHDDCCHFEEYAKKNNTDAFRSIKYWVMDKLHQSNHKCSKRQWTRREKKSSSNMCARTCQSPSILGSEG